MSVYRTAADSPETSPTVQPKWVPQLLLRTVYKVIQLDWRASDSDGRLETKLNEAALEGWKPVLMSDSGGAYTIILERPEELKEGATP